MITEGGPVVVFDGWIAFEDEYTGKSEDGTVQDWEYAPERLAC